MGKRHTGRKIAMQLLFQFDYAKEDVDRFQDVLFIESSVLEETRDFATKLANDAWAFRETSDELIQKYSIDWDLSRLNAVDKALMRLAFYEIVNTDISSSVVVNEVVELSNKFSTEYSSSFINGILGAYLKDHV